MKTIEDKRRVSIIPVSVTGHEILSNHRPSAWMVRYIDRKKGQRWNRAQFCATDTTRAEVVKWVKAQPNLDLIEDCSRAAMFKCKVCGSGSFERPWTFAGDCMKRDEAVLKCTKCGAMHRRKPATQRTEKEG